MDGIKTGMTSEAGYCLAATAVRDGLRLIAVTLGAPTSAARDEDIRRLLDYGFTRLKAVIVAKEGDQVADVGVAKGAAITVPLIAGADLSVAMPRESTSRPETEIVPARRPVAPIKQGEVLAHLVARLDGVEVGRVPLLAQSPVEKASIFTMIGRYFLNIVRLS